MRRSWFVTTTSVLLGIVVLLVLSLAACGGSSDSGSNSSAGAGPPKGDAFDKAFIDAMVPHHESAIEMARAAKEAGLTQPDLIAVADAILATQQSEIDQMTSWRGDWFGSSEIDPKGGEALGFSDSEMGMSATHGGADALMNSGDVDTDFAQMMITHHNGAIAMAKLADDRAGHEELKELAGQIIEAQEREIEVMRNHAAGMSHG